MMGQASQRNFTQVPNVLFNTCDLPDEAIMMFNRLCCQVGHKGGIFHGSIRKLATALNIKRDKAHRNLKVLDGAGLATVGIDPDSEASAIKLHLDELWELNAAYSNGAIVPRWTNLQEALESVRKTGQDTHAEVSEKPDKVSEKPDSLSDKSDGSVRKTGQSVRRSERKVTPNTSNTSNTESNTSNTSGADRAEALAPLAGVQILNTQGKSNSDLSTLPAQEESTPRQGTRKPRKPSPSAELQARIARVYDFFDKLQQEVMHDPGACYARTKKDDEAIVTWLKTNPTEALLREVYFELWNTPEDPKTHYNWQAHMSIQAVLRQYGTLVMAIKSKRRRIEAKHIVTTSTAFLTTSYEPPEEEEDLPYVGPQPIRKKV